MKSITVIVTAVVLAIMNQSSQIVPGDLAIAIVGLIGITVRIVDAVRHKASINEIMDILDLKNAEILRLSTDKGEENE